MILLYRCTFISFFLFSSFVMRDKRKKTVFNRKQIRITTVSSLLLCNFSKRVVALLILLSPLGNGQVC